MTGLSAMREAAARWSRREAVVEIDQMLEAFDGAPFNASPISADLVRMFGRQKAADPPRLVSQRASTST